MRSVCVYCGSNTGAKPAYAERAAILGTRLAREGLALVYGGGNIGLMGIVADAALAAGGEVVGVIPEQLVGWEVAHAELSRLEVVASMHERKARMFDLSDAFVALPGGFGTMDEMFELLTLRQTDTAPRIPIVLVDRDYWQSVINFEKLVEFGMVNRPDLDLFGFADDAEGIWRELLARGLVPRASIELEADQHTS